MVAKVADFTILAVSFLIKSLGGTEACCRFEPTCTQYAREVVSHYGILKGGWFAMHRLLHCHPFSRSYR